MVDDSKKLKPRRQDVKNPGRQDVKNPAVYLGVWLFDRDTKFPSKIAPVDPVEVPQGAIVRPENYSVSIYFDGKIDRDAVIAIAKDLEREGWQMRKLNERGGVKRDRNALRFNEVRFNPGSSNNEAAAAMVARVVQQANLTPVQIRPVKDMKIPSNTLEVWFSRPPGGA
jgi:hypothetical protein